MNLHTRRQYELSLCGVGKVRGMKTVYGTSLFATTGGAVTGPEV